MRRCFFSLLVVSLIAGCRVKSNDAASEAASPDPIPIQDNERIDDPPPAPESYQPLERPAQLPIISSIPDDSNEDPAPMPPLDGTQGNDEQDQRSAKAAFDSVARVLQGAIAGQDEETGEPAKKSVFGSVGRALMKGFQEAATSEE